MDHNWRHYTPVGTCVLFTENLREHCSSDTVSSVVSQARRVCFLKCHSPDLQLPLTQNANARETGLAAGSSRLASWSSLTETTTIWEKATPAKKSPTTQRAGSYSPSKKRCRQKTEVANNQYWGEIGRMRSHTVSEKQVPKDSELRKERTEQMELQRQKQGGRDANKILKIKKSAERAMTSFTFPHRSTKKE